MPLTDEQQERITTWIHSKWKQHNECLLCNSNSWSVTGIFEMRSFHGGTLVVGGDSSVLPVLPVICNNCGNTVLLSAVVIGLTPRNSEKAGPEKAGLDTPPGSTTVDHTHV